MPSRQQPLEWHAVPRVRCDRVKVFCWLSAPTGADRQDGTQRQDDPGVALRPLWPVCRLAACAVGFALAKLELHNARMHGALLQLASSSGGKNVAC